MKGRWQRWCVAAALVALAAYGCGFSDESEPTRSPGACEATVGEQCVGVPPTPVCEDDLCTLGTSCEEIFEVRDEGSLEEALDRATAGDCIALFAGRYPAVDLPGSVSLLGRSAEDVTVGPINVQEGQDTLLRGLTVEGGIDLGNAGGVHLEAVRVVGGEIGVFAGASASVTISDSEVRRSERLGVVGSDAAAIALERSIVGEPTGPGVWAQCTPDASGCCATPSQLSLRTVLVSGSQAVGVHARGVSARLEGVDVAAVSTASDGVPGAGLVVSECGSLSYASLSVAHTEGAGVLLDRSSAAPLDPDEEGIVVVDSMPGVWVQNVASAEGVTLANLNVQQARMAGLGFDLDSQGIVVVDSRVGDTRAVSEIGIGVVWKGSAQASIGGLTISASAGFGMLIDGPVGAGSRIENLTLQGGDEDEGVVQQNVTSLDDAPLVDATVSLEQSESEVATVPDSLSLPATQL